MRRGNRLVRAYNWLQEWRRKNAAVELLYSLAVDGVVVLLILLIFDLTATGVYYLNSAFSRVTSAPNPFLPLPPQDIILGVSDATAVILYTVMALGEAIVFLARIVREVYDRVRSLSQGGRGEGKDG